MAIGHEKSVKTETMHFFLFLYDMFCKVGSFNYDNTKMVFVDEFIADHRQIRSVLDYSIKIEELPDMEKNYEALTGAAQQTQRYCKVLEET